MAYTPESGGNQSRYQEHERADTNFDFDSHSFLDPSLLSVDQAHAQASLVATGNQSADYSSLGPVEDSRFRAATDISGPLHIDFVQERLPVASSESFQQANHGPSEHLDDDFFEAYSAEHGSRRIPPAENYSGLYTEQSTAPLAANNSNTTNMSFLTSLYSRNVVAATKNRYESEEMRMPEILAVAAPGERIQRRKLVERPSHGRLQQLIGGVSKTTLRPPKKQHPATHAVVVVPDYSQVPLMFDSQKQAWETSRDLLAATVHMPPEDDETLPQNDSDRKDVVRSLLGAMRDTDQCIDQSGLIYKNRWGPERKAGYDIRHMEKVCWDILFLTERMHREGPHVLNVYDTAFLHKSKKESHYTFAQRIDAICQLMLSLKSRVDQLMRGDSLARIVIAPTEARTSSNNNRMANDRRAAWYSRGKEVEGLEAEASLGDAGHKDDYMTAHGSSSFATPGGPEESFSPGMGMDDRPLIDVDPLAARPQDGLGNEAVAAGIGTAKETRDRTASSNNRVPEGADVGQYSSSPHV